MQDTSTQAMTEVALGLSMAFFSLLILALLSIGLPQDSQMPVTDAREPSMQIDLESSLTLAQQSQQSENKSEQADMQPSFVFYYRGAYFNEALEQVLLESLELDSSHNADANTIVAVSSRLAFSEVMQVHKDFAHVQVQITAMDDTWEQALKAIRP
jgi:hypothetical protein